MEPSVPKELRAGARLLGVFAAMEPMASFGAGASKTRSSSSSSSPKSKTRLLLFLAASLSVEGTAAVAAARKSNRGMIMQKRAKKKGDENEKWAVAQSSFS
jgi:hypothetical protein